MNQTIMQPMKYNLYLNIGQMQNIADGLVENRRNVHESFLEEYDIQMNHIFDQYRKQGVHVDVPSETDKKSDYEQALASIDRLTVSLTDTDQPNSEEAIEELKHLKTLLFG